MIHVLPSSVGKYFENGCLCAIIIKVKLQPTEKVLQHILKNHSKAKYQVDVTHIADVVADNPAEEELRAVRDGLPCAQGVDVLLSVFDLRQREFEQIKSPSSLFLLLSFL